MREPAFGKSENKGTDQLFHYIDSIIPLLSKSIISSSSHLIMCLVSAPYDCGEK